ncbi:MAG TPA: hypothetical protein VN797_04710 [Gemmatimonadaceae bacterium]|jgi:hypothetical protein|nr:hypothetical protein [Gemmatimonadaceae bacterium]
MKYRIALPVLVLILAGACSANDATSPNAKVSPRAGIADRESARSGWLHAVKNCGGYHGLAGQSCILTSTNLRQIPDGSTVTYASALGTTTLNSDIIITPPGPGNSVAFGHVDLNLITRTGVATLNGGTGVFKHFSATVNIVKIVTADGHDWTWDGPFSFGSGEGDDEGGDQDR